MVPSVFGPAALYQRQLRTAALAGGNRRLAWLHFDTDTASMAMTDDIETRRRRALYRAQHRGTKEMDLVVGGYAAAKLAEMPDAQLALFEQLLELPDPAIEAAVFGREALNEAQLATLIMTLRQFHGLQSRLL
jgi:antitoxin CptB